jgi:hypothetical protein
MASVDDMWWRLRTRVYRSAVPSVKGSSAHGAPKNSRIAKARFASPAVYSGENLTYGEVTGGQAFPGVVAIFFESVVPG